MKRFLLLVLFTFTIFFKAKEQVVSAKGFKNSKSVDNKEKSERILSFHSDIVIHKNSSLTVTETIIISSRGKQFKRGIFRAFPYTRNLNGETQMVKFQILSVKKNGITENYFTENKSAQKIIYIGQEDVFLKPGKYTYEITYETQDQIGFFPEYDELYWNVNGMAWDLPIDSISALVHLPEGVKMIQNSCYTGLEGSTAQNCSSKIISDYEIEWQANNLSSHENMTIAVGFSKNIVNLPPPSFSEKYLISIFLGMFFCGLLLYGFKSWQKYGKDPIKPVPYPQFDVPENMSPAELGYIHHEGYRDNYISASLVNLAVKKFVEIEEKTSKSFLGISSNKIYRITRLKLPTTELAKEEINIMTNLFSDSSTITFNGTFSHKIQLMVNNFEDDLGFKYDKMIMEGNNSIKAKIPSILIFLIFTLTFVISSAIGDSKEQTRNGYLGLVFVTFLSTFVFMIPNMKGLTKGYIKAFIVLFTPLFIGFFVFILYGNLNQNTKASFIFLIASVVFISVYKYLIKKPSEEKLRKQSLIEGFKMYMEAAENELIKFHNPPVMTPEMFEKYLPYAMVLGVDKIWGKKFQKILNTMSTDYRNDWSKDNTIVVSNLESKLNISLTHYISTSAIPPATSSTVQRTSSIKKSFKQNSSGSSSSSSSGSRGSGYSGGGGGGGGGW